jgi:NADP-dependent 3-hydroxy acid dehydrogenase YdfG
MASMTDAAYRSLKGRPVLITGGATGIGEAMVRAFAEQGARVAFIDIAKREGRALAEELEGADGPVHFACCDITETDAFQAAIRDFGIWRRRAARSRSSSTTPPTTSATNGAT